MHVISVVGARPQFVKLSPIAHAFAARGVDHSIVHTGQHYDPGMSQSFFDDLAIPAPARNLGIGSGSHGEQNGAMIPGLERAFLELNPDWVLVYGDTNSTLAAAVAAVKIHLPVAHLEAGLRSFNRRMPEEHNRVLTDHAADLLLAPTQTAMQHLADEGLAQRSLLVGDVMTDVCLSVGAQVGRAAIGDFVPGLDGEPYVLATLHRAENTDDPQRLLELVRGLQRLDAQVVLTAHPRLVAKAREHDVTLQAGNVHIIRPLPYPSMVSAIKGAVGVVTDSGGLQKEAYILGTVCTTMRTETEWPETIASGWNTLAADPDEMISVATRPAPLSSGPRDAYGDGRAAGRVAQALHTH